MRDLPTIKQCARHVETVIGHRVQTRYGKRGNRGQKEKVTDRGGTKENTSIELNRMKESIQLNRQWKAWDPRKFGTKTTDMTARQEDGRRIAG